MLGLADRQRSVFTLKTFCAKVIDSFQIDGRGTVVLLAIPSDANIVVSIGDNILIDSAQRTSTAYTVLGVEMARGLPPDRCGLALLVKSESNISSGDTVWTDRSIIEEIQIQYNGTVERLQSAIFPDRCSFAADREDRRGGADRAGLRRVAPAAVASGIMRRWDGRGQSVRGVRPLPGGVTVAQGILVPFV